MPTVVLLVPDSCLHDKCSETHHEAIMLIKTETVPWGWVARCLRFILLH